LLHKYIIATDPKPKATETVWRIAGSGPQCPVCGKQFKEFLKSRTTGTEYGFMAARYLQPKPERPIETPVRIAYKLYRGSRRKTSDLELYGALDKILVSGRVLASEELVKSRDGSRVLYDREHPRAEIYIYEYEEDENGG